MFTSFLKMSKGQSLKMPSYRLCVCGADHKPLPKALQTPRGVYDLFKEEGEIINVSYLQTEDGVPPGVVFIGFIKNESAIKACKDFTHKEFEDGKIICKENIKTDFYRKFNETKTVVKGIPKDVSYKTVQKHLKRFGGIISLEKDPETNNYTVDFRSPKGLNRYKHLHNVFLITDEEVQVEEDEPVVEPVNDEPVVEPVNDEPVDEPVVEPVDEPVNDEPVDEPANEENKKDIAIKASIAIASVGALALCIMAFMKRRNNK